MEFNIFFLSEVISLSEFTTSGVSGEWLLVKLVGKGIVLSQKRTLGG